MIAFLRGKAPYALGLVLMFAVGHLTALYTRPVGKIETHTERQLQTVDNSKKIDVSELVSQLSTMMQKKNVSTSRTEKRPDGTVIEEKSVDLTETNSKVESTATTLTSIDERLKLLDEKLKVDEKIEIPMAAPAANSRLSFGLGYDVRSLFGHHEEYNLLHVSGMVGQVQYERRLFKSLWWYLWAQSTGSGGAGIKYEW